MIYKYFTEEEFKRLTPSCSLSDMDEDFMMRLDDLRLLLREPICLSCAYRSESWDKSKGRSGLSWHCKGKAVDVKCPDSSYAYRLVQFAFLVGMTGIIVYPTFVHLDRRTGHPILLRGDV